MSGQRQYTSVLTLESLSSVHASCGKRLCLTSLPPSSAQWDGSSKQPPEDLRWLISRKKKMWQKTSGVGAGGGGGLGSENTTQEILKLQMRLKGENIMGVKAEGYTVAVIELKCTLCLISLTALICCFKSSKCLGKQGTPLSQPAGAILISLQKTRCLGAPRRQIWE